MNTNMENFMKLVTPGAEDSVNARTELAFRIKNRKWIKQSQKIALSILNAMEDLSWDKEKLGAESFIPFETIQLMVTGKYDFSLSEISMLEEALKTQITSYGNK